MREQICTHGRIPYQIDWQFRLRNMNPSGQKTKTHRGTPLFILKKGELRGARGQGIEERRSICREIHTTKLDSETGEHGEGGSCEEDF